MNIHPEAKEDPKTARINNEIKQSKTRHMSRPTKPPKVGTELSTEEWEGGMIYYVLPIVDILRATCRCQVSILGRMLT
jgi:hypothetical protein